MLIISILTPLIVLTFKCINLCVILIQYPENQLIEKSINRWFFETLWNSFETSLEQHFLAKMQNVYNEQSHPIGGFVRYINGKEKSYNPQIL